MTEHTKNSKYLSYLLRHRPETAKLTLDTEGWCSLVELCTNTDLTYDEVLEIVRTDDKQRYSLKPADFVAPTHIRANQGHSNPNVKLTFKKAVPPVVLYHGTQPKSWDVISRQGLLPMSRHHVHLTDDVHTAAVVGGRRKGGALVLTIDAKQMLTDGIPFYLSDNGVWLVSAVLPKYIKADFL